MISPGRTYRFYYPIAALQRKIILAARALADQLAAHDRTMQCTGCYWGLTKTKRRSPPSKNLYHERGKIYTQLVKILIFMSVANNLKPHKSI